MRIKSFMVGPHKVKIYYRQTVKHPDGEVVMGYCDYNTNQLYVSTKYKGKVLSESSILHNTLHEAMHLTTYLMGYQDLTKNEDFIDLLACFLAQIMLTQE